MSVENYSAPSNRQAVSSKGNLINEAAHLQARRHLLLMMIQGHSRSQIVCSFAKLGIADHLADEPQNADAVADRLRLNRDLLMRLFRASTSCGLTRQLEDGRLHLTALGAMLISGPGSLRDVAVRVHDLDYRAWGAFCESLASGEIPFNVAYGTGFYEYLDREHLQASFDEEMTATSLGQAQAVVRSYDFSNVGSIVDIGGGRGALLAEILLSTERTEGVLFDLPKVIESASSYLQSRAVSEKCRLVAGSFFEVLPAGGDIYIMKRILHNWNDEHCLHILASCRQAMDKDKRLLIIDYIMPERTEGPDPVVDSDLMMHVLMGGCERTVAHFEALLHRTGFERSAIRNAGQLSLIEAIAC